MARPVGVTLDQILDAATALADRDGLEGLTLAAVAESIGIRSPSLYAHVDGLTGLRRQLQLRAVSRLGAALSAAARGTNGDGNAALHAVARTYRAFAREHPGLFTALLPAPRPGEDDELYATMAESAQLIAGLVMDLGVTEDRAIDAVRTFRSMVHGFVVLEQGGGFGMPRDVDASFEHAVDVVLRGAAQR